MVSVKGVYRNRGRGYGNSGVEANDAGVDDAGLISWEVDAPAGGLCKHRASTFSCRGSGCEGQSR